MPECGFCLGFEFRDDPLGKDLAEFNSPLIKGVDVPDGALGKDAVLVERDELTKHLRCKPLGEDRVRRTVALENSMGHEPMRRAFGFHLLWCLPKGQRLGLGENVRQKHVVVSAKRVERLDKRDKVTRDEPRPLMYQLIERVLAVGSRLAPVDWPGRAGDRGPIERDVFAVALHRQLLKVGRKSLQVLLVWEDCNGLRA